MNIINADGDDDVMTAIEMGEKMSRKAMTRKTANTTWISAMPTTQCVDDEYSRNNEDGRNHEDNTMATVISNTITIKATTIKRKQLLRRPMNYDNKQYDSN